MGNALGATASTLTHAYSNAGHPNRGANTVSWRVAATVIIVVFTATIAWTTLSDPLVQTGNAFQSISTSGQLATDTKISGMINGFFNMFLVLIFGLFAWGAWRVLRRELTRGRL